MLKLKHLFDNRDLAVMLLENWEYDRSKNYMLNYCRISANAIYPFIKDGKKLYLRFAPVCEKNPSHVKAELDFLRYLRYNGYRAIETVKSQQGLELVQKHTPWGEYTAVVFKEAAGTQVCDAEYSNELYFRIGKSLARLHDLSEKYTPHGDGRHDWRQILSWVQEALETYCAPPAAIKEAHILAEAMNSLPQSPKNYGLIHFDFETDNLFYEHDSGSINPIDFDDCHYNWYAADIERSLDSLNGVSNAEKACREFLAGYRSERAIDEQTFGKQHIFTRYANLYGYARCLRSVSDVWDNEPDWMSNLRTHLNQLMHERSRSFGEALD